MEALEWARQLPGRENIGAGYEALSEWQRSQPAAAQEWVRALDLKDPRREPFFAGIVSTLTYTPGGAEQLAAMTSAEKITARGLIEKMALTEERRSALLGALQIP